MQNRAHTRVLTEWECGTPIVYTIFFPTAAYILSNEGGNKNSRKPYGPKITGKIAHKHCSFFLSLFFTSPFLLIITFLFTVANVSAAAASLHYPAHYFTASQLDSA